MNTYLCFCLHTDPVHESTNQTPYGMLFGRHAQLPVDLTCCLLCTERKLPSLECVLELQERLQKMHKLARSKMLKASDRQKKTYDHRVHVIPYIEVDLVWLLLGVFAQKLQPRWEGPYQLTRIISDLVVEKGMPGKKKSEKIVHHNRIVPYVR